MLLTMDLLQLQKYGQKNHVSVVEFIIAACYYYYNYYYHYYYRLLSECNLGQMGLKRFLSLSFRPSFCLPIHLP